MCCTPRDNQLVIIYFIACVCQSLSLQPTDCCLPGFSVRGILQARILEWVAIPFSRGSSLPRNQTRSPALQPDSLPSEPPGKHTSQPPCDKTENFRLIPVNLANLELFILQHVRTSQGKISKEVRLIF